MNSFGCFEGHLYGLVLNQPNAGVNQPPSIDLVKYSLSTGEHVQQQTANYKILDETMVNCINRMSNFACYIGKTLFVSSLRVGKQEIFSLDLETLEWKRTQIRLENVASISTHEKGTLLVTAYNYFSSAERVFRFVFNEPDKLSDLSWLQLKRIFDARPSAYEFILSQLPKNFKQKCPLPPQ
ncbi:hypothetical protein M3Y95_00188300 [Aphelenchoides besseyi]|nr:hypothetical protein M3Y95_00188300 [Aphelenchoides besseyi]